MHQSVDENDCISLEDTRASSASLTFDELRECRHITNTLASSWTERQEQEQAVQRVWPCPGQLSQPAAEACSDDSSSDDDRWSPWMAFFDSRNGKGAQGYDGYDSGPSMHQRRRKRHKTGPTIVTQPSKLRGRIVSALQTAEGLGWEEIAGEENIQGGMRYLSTWQNPVQCKAGAEWKCRESVSDMLAAKLRWENGSAWLQGPPGRPRVVDVEGDGHDDVAAAMKEALLSLGETMSDMSMRHTADGERRQRLKRIKRSALAKAADRLELAIAAGVEYREACLQLQQKKQVIQGLGSGFPEPRTAVSRMAIQLSGAPAVPGVSQHVEACLNLHLTGGNTKGVSTAQQSVCPQRTSNQTSEQPRATGDSAPDGTLPSSTQRLGFADIVTRLRAVLTRADSTAGCMSETISGLLESLVWLPEKPWDEPQLFQLERLLNSTGAMAQIGTKLREAEAQQVKWRAGQQRRPVHATDTASAQLDILSSSLLPFLTNDLREGQVSVLADGWRAECKDAPRDMHTRQHVGQQAWEGRGLEGFSSQEEAACSLPQSRPPCSADIMSGSETAGVQHEEQHRPDYGPADVQAAAVHGSAAEEERMRTARAIAATQAGLRVAWGALDWMLRYASAIASTDTVDEGGPDPGTSQFHYKKVRGMRRARAARAMNRDALPPQPVPLCNTFAPHTSRPTDSAAAATSGLPPAAASHLKRCVAGGALSVRWVEGAAQDAEMLRKPAAARQPNLGTGTAKAGSKDRKVQDATRFCRELVMAELPPASRLNMQAHQDGEGGPSPAQQCVQSTGQQIRMAHCERLGINSAASRMAPIVAPAPGWGALHLATLQSLASSMDGLVAEHAKQGWGIPCSPSKAVRSWENEGRAGRPMTRRTEPIARISLQQSGQASFNGVVKALTLPNSRTPNGLEERDTPQARMSRAAEERNPRWCDIAQYPLVSTSGHAHEAARTAAMGAGPALQPWLQEQSGAGDRGTLADEMRNTLHNSTPSANEQSDYEEALHQLPIDVQMVFEAGARLGLGYDLTRDALSKFCSVVGLPSQLPR